jgi:hypothetical protein
MDRRDGLDLLLESIIIFSITEKVEGKEARLIAVTVKVDVVYGRGSCA